jgi:hypothetical protein
MVSESGSVDQERPAMTKKKRKKEKKTERCQKKRKKNMMSLDICFKKSYGLRVFSEFILVYEFFSVVRSIEKK